MNRPTELIETLERLLKLAIDGTPISYADHAALEEASSYGSLQKLTRWLGVLERALEIMGADAWQEPHIDCYLAKAARELEARDDTKMVSDAKVE